MSPPAIHPTVAAMPLPSHTVGDQRRLWLLLGVGLLYWIEFWNQLRVDWTVNPQYAYGWFVPLLAAGLFWRRWLDRPTQGGLILDANPALRWVALVSAIALLGCLLPVRVVLEANPDWRLPFWLMGAATFILSLLAIVGVGGWSWLRHFWFPIAFLLVAIPWPMALEKLVIQGLMRVVTEVTVEVVGWLGIPAIAHGNIIEIAGGRVGVDEACSGVRSLQSSLMVGLFLGEFCRFRWRWRLGLLGSAMLLAFVANVGRTSFLTWCAATRGSVTMRAWHDSAGLAVAVLSFGGIWVLATLLQRRPSMVSPSRRPDGESAEAGRFPLPRPFALPRLVLMLAWLVAVELATDLWYRVHEGPVATGLEWTLRIPPSATDVQEQEISEDALAMLRCTNSRKTSWKDTDGNLWSLFHLRWPPGRNSVSLAKGHRPDICLTGVGWELKEDLGYTPIEVHGLKFLFRRYVFDQGGRKAHVFYGIWEDHSGAGAEAIPQESTPGNRLSAVLAGRRNRGQQLIEALVWGPESAEDAWRVYGRTLEDLIVPTPGKR